MLNCLLHLGFWSNYLTQILVVDYLLLRLIISNIYSNFSINFLISVKLGITCEHIHYIYGAISSHVTSYLWYITSDWNVDLLERALKPLFAQPLPKGH